MKKFYLIYAGCVFALFCFFQWRGTAWDTNQRTARPQYYSYHGGGAGGVLYGSSSRSRGGSYYSHK